MQKHFKVIGCNVLRREVFFCAAQSPHVIDTVLLPQGLHDQPEVLRTAVQAAIDAPVPAAQFRQRPMRHVAADRPYDAILLAYALCSNGLAGITARDCPLIIPRAHDCITLLLGSRRRYQEEFEKHPGTYWYSAGWIETCLMPGKRRFETELAVYTEKYGADNAEYLLRMENEWLRKYDRAAYIDWGFPNAAEEKNFTKRCAEELGWRYAEIVGDSMLLQKMLNGDWDNGHFLVVPPGTATAADPSGSDILKIKS